MTLSQLLQKNLRRYLAEAKDSDSNLVLSNQRQDPAYAVSIDTYHFNSQRWPKNEIAEQGPLWRHTLVLYRPQVISHPQALLFVNSGTINEAAGEETTQPHLLNFARLAAETQALVVDLQDVPNQYLTFEDQVPRKGDRLYAYSWRRFLDDPEKNADWPLSLPMTQAIVKAMDVVQELMQEKYGNPITAFVVAGLSKRGLSTWLAALHDERIAAIVPVVIDILNTQETLKHIYACYNQWPPAFTDFIKEKIPERMSSPAFKELMNLEDPLAYLQGKEAAYYKKRFSIPKYLIQASGDDFFTPDCLSLYLDQIPGETQIRMVPNQGHLISLDVVEDALLVYFRAFLKKTAFPRINWRFSAQGTICEVETDQPPQSVSLWQAENRESRDFRLACKIQYLEQPLIGTHREGLYHYPVEITEPKQGFKAYFIELGFSDSKGATLFLTTPAYVLASSAHPEAAK